MKLKCKHCGDESLVYIGMPTKLQWICPNCFLITDNYDIDIRDMRLDLDGGVSNEQ
ncbi:MAG: hypothetical protein GF317_06130 [Candidatus Lokiarchaeota archaeon]|nr:hypothetical protein [Candidatus Lokiarchaeota archaeon]